MNKKTKNNVWLLSDPYISLSLRLYLIRHAKKSIRIQTFIWGEDDMSYLLLGELKKAAARGVRVELLIDGWVGVDHPGLILELKDCSNSVFSKHYNPPTRVVFPSLIRVIRSVSINAKRLNHRMHSKIFSVDDNWSILGGRNYESHYFGVSEKKFFRDREILIHGSISKEIVAVFVKFWNHKLSIATNDLQFTYQKNTGRHKFITKHTKIKVPDNRKNLSDSKLLGEFQDFDTKFNTASWLLKENHPVNFVKLFYDLPGGYEDKISQSATEMLDIVANAKKEIVLQTPYLIFGENTLEVFRGISKQKVPPIFKFITNSYASNDNILAHILGNKERYILRKLKNVKIFEYLKYPLTRIKHEPKNSAICDHGKTLIIDGLKTYIGSSNFDPRSHNLNSEIGVLVEDQRFAKEVRKDINQSLIEGNFFVESEVVDGIDRLKFLERLRNIYLTVCFEPNLPSIGRILLYPFRFLVPLRLKRYF